MKLIITVVGRDQIGIIAKVTNILADNGVNILDIRQTIMSDKFTMMMSVEQDEKMITIAGLKEKLNLLEKNMALAIQVYSEEIFNFMHKI